MISSKFTAGAGKLYSQLELPKEPQQLDVSPMALVVVAKAHISHACRGDFGRLGHGSCSDSFVPHPIKALAGKKVINVACGDTHSIAMTSDGSLYGFGRNLNGQLGLGSNTDVLQPVLIQALQVLLLCPLVHPQRASPTYNISFLLQVTTLSF